VEAKNKITQKYASPTRKIIDRKTLNS